MATVTIRQLLTHVSGLPNILNVLDPVTYGLPKGATEEQLWTKLKAMPVNSAPGERFSYNQTNYALLGKVIDKLSGKPFARVFDEKQFQIAAMQATGFGDSRDLIPNLASTYRYVRNIDGERLSVEKLIKDEVFNELKKKDADFQPLENDLNDWAYRMMNGGGRPKEAYAVNGERELAIKNYKRSLELDPKNTNAMQQLRKLDPKP